MVFSVTSVYSLDGDGTKTLNTLTNMPAGSSDLSSLSSVNYPTEGVSVPNTANQSVFKNQPLSWWVASLNSGVVKYTPVSSDVNWSYTDSNTKAIHISMEISNLLIPNKSSNTSRAPGSTSAVTTFEPKFGINRVDTLTM